MWLIPDLELSVRMIPFAASLKRLCLQCGVQIFTQLIDICYESRIRSNL